jgi:hypothetical protein
MLDLLGGRQRVRRPLEDDEKRVALGLHLDALARQDGLADQPVVITQQLRVGVRAERL